MTRGTVHQYDSDRGTGVLCCIAGTLVPFSSRNPALCVGDEITVRLVGGIAGLYATDVTPAAAPQRQTATASRGFLWRSGTLAPLAG
jgi:hypothetical protein